MNDGHGRACSVWWTGTDSCRAPTLDDQRSAFRQGKQRDLRDGARYHLLAADALRDLETGHARGKAVLTI